MINKRLLGAILASMITISGVTSVIAAPIQQNQTRQEQKQHGESDAEMLTRLKEKAERLGVNIEGLTLEQAREKIHEARQKDMEKKAKELNIDTKNLSNERMKEKIYEATRSNLEKEAKKLGIDISGLSIREAKDKISEAKGVKR
ncbi:MAG: hypothetical protein ACM3X7_05350 [Solirubrobacterales bacterium]